MPLPTTRRLASCLALLTIGALALSSCSVSPGSADASPSETSAASSGWPRTFENSDGTTTEIPEQPEHIVSTSASVAGTLLAFDAPLVASGSAGDGAFFAQWADTATERGVENLWAAGAPDVEAIYNYTPDLIVVSASGADSVTDLVPELEGIAPTIVVDYGGQTWQDLALELGEATGLEEQAETAVTDFDAYVADAADAITVPAGTANIISYNGAGEDNPIAREGSAQGQLLAELGFTIEDPNVEWHTQEQVREDFVWTAFENLVELTSDTTFILSQDDAGARAFAEDPVLANLPSVRSEQVYGLGANSFRVDMYSATEIVDGIVEEFGN